MSRRTILIAVLFVIFTWAGAAGIAVGLAQTMEGPRGEQGPSGPEGPKGERGPRGAAGAAADDVLISIEGQIHPSFAIAQLARFWAVEQWQEILGESVTTDHPQVDACVNYILKFEGSSSDCGFHAVEP